MIIILDRNNYLAFIHCDIIDKSMYQFIMVCISTKYLFYVTQVLLFENRK